MEDGVRKAIERREDESLSRYAQRSAAGAGRTKPEEPDPLRTCYMRDRDRILHSKPFRRLKYKTQVFIAPVGDHYRTRLTHTLEVAQVARTIGRALRLNEDLIEAIALGHDTGHTPFGHAGEEALDRALKRSVGDDARFRHYEQSLRVLEVLTGLNLTEEVKSGIGGHSKGRADLSSHDGEPTSTLEAAVVRISDRIAYLNHDLDDALRSGIVRSIPDEFTSIGATHGRRVGAMVADVVEHSLDQPAIALSPRMLSAMNALKEWLYDHVYLRYPTVNPDTLKAQGVVQALFSYYVEDGMLPDGYLGVQGAVDYVSGMTDRFAIGSYERLFVPRGFDETLKTVP
ncbi:MAG: deoxyguanosinetriphosphate triphosphohydrolase [Armatimonadetes bacterium]|nr:deoxyguanosinetriphosphate triphosphohydrolase [Armatimonadota bacterium]